MARRPQIRIAVAGGLNTDIVAMGVDRIPGPGGQTVGGRLAIGPGGKSRNIAEMAAVFLGPGRVAMIGRTCRDPYGLWRPPLEALRRAGVDTRRVAVGRGSRSLLPSAALIAVDTRGRNQICVLPGVNERFSPADAAAAAPLLDEAALNGGMLVLTLEMPAATAAALLAAAAKRRLRAVLDPGGIVPSTDAAALFVRPPEIIKPNEHEAFLLTGVRVAGFDSARRAAAVLRRRGVRTVLITHGPRGAYLFTPGAGVRIPAPRPPASPAADSTGCGDQTTAVLACLLAGGMAETEAARRAVAAGALQFARPGIVPVSRRALTQFLKIRGT